MLWRSLLRLLIVLLSHLQLLLVLFLWLLPWLRLRHPPTLLQLNLLRLLLRLRPWLFLWLLLRLRLRHLPTLLR
ncbi:MAG TPA: hypothetical protein EYQ10_06135 [Gammaproteobacteria bacterium]|nr:hypothetical protein [Gammaproteobacteria bacterium]